MVSRWCSQADVAKHLAETYGDRAWGVCSKHSGSWLVGFDVDPLCAGMAEPTGLRWPVHGTRLDPGFPYIDAEVAANTPDPDSNWLKAAFTGDLGLPPRVRQHGSGRHFAADAPVLPERRGRARSSSKSDRHHGSRAWMVEE